MSKIKHEPKFYIRFCSNKIIHFPKNFIVYPGSIYGRYQNLKGERIFWVCDCYKTFAGKLSIHVFNGIYWKLCVISSDHPCYKWIEKACKKIGYIPKIQSENITFDKCKNIMKANSRRKKGNGGRINTHQINNPLNWNEVTEIAHWYGKGNASVVAANIK